MYTTKYRPNKLDDFVGNKNVIQPFIRWLLEWDANDKKTKCALVSGVNGVGKSLLVELILKKHDYNIINLSIDDDRDKETINETIKPLLKTKKTFNGQDNCLVVSDIDSNAGDYGFIANLTDCIKETQIPIVCICDDRYSQNIKPILNYCVDFKMTKPNYNDVYALVYKVVTAENIKINKATVDNLYEQGKSAEEVARAVSQMRRDIGIKYKDMTPPKQLQEIYERNIEQYKDKLGPKIEWYRGQGISWEKIIEKAIKPGGKDIDFNRYKNK
jgi:DNA polymerase III delta prime subunit